MSEPLQYVTNQDGERVGVLLDLETYQRLTNPSAEDDEILTDLTHILHLEK
ncbi:MAG: hypothetical protein AAFW70_16520 [Cyanobacteria bacterium J06635_10]